MKEKLLSKLKDFKFWLFAVLPWAIVITVLVLIFVYRNQLNFVSAVIAIGCFGFAALLFSIPKLVKAVKEKDVYGIVAASMYLAGMIIFYGVICYILKLYNVAYTESDAMFTQLKTLEFGTDEYKQLWAEYSEKRDELFRLSMANNLNLICLCVYQLAIGWITGYLKKRNEKKSKTQDNSEIKAETEN